MMNGQAITDNEIYLLIKYIKTVFWRVAKYLSYIEEARCVRVNRKLVVQTFALRVSDAYLDRYSINSNSFPILQTGRRNTNSDIYILAKQPTLSCCNIVHCMVLLNFINCLYKYAIPSCSKKVIPLFKF